ncbi:MAG: DUF4214 domain-containing protein [Clostridiales bacterium]|nr:DUF4214 domain-containing protein [Clostridiales bacterium]
MRKKLSLRVLAVMIIAVILTMNIAPSVRIVRADNEGITRFVYSLYSECLGRKPDPTGLNDWVQKLASGQISGKQAAYGFFFSEEFLAVTCDSEIDETIDRFYRVFLDRPSDIDGFYYWYERLFDADGSISMLFNGFADSEEFRNKCLSFGINPGDHISVPEGYGRTEVFFSYCWWEGAMSPDARAFLQNHADRTPRSTYPTGEHNGAMTGSNTVSAADYAICQRFADEHFRAEWTDLEKLEYTALWIRLNVHYAYGGVGGSYCDAIFNQHLGQCAQYNGAMLAMMSYLGYDVRMVHGHIGRRHNNHYWGEMDANGVTYIIDTGCIEDNNLHFMVNAAEWADYYTP